MCGIAGAVTASTSRPIQPHADLVRSMCDVMAHRGPDADGFWSDGQAALGHRRLAIIDLTEGGRQPMTNEDGTLWITFNGEIYNFHELRDALVEAGHVFRSHSDTEAILHAYEQWGDDCVTRFRGMFAFAIWDTRRKRLFAARDRIGKKPFFYVWDGQVLRFASELASIVSDPEVSRNPDPAAIDFYLTWGYVPAPQTAYKSVSKLPPAHTLALELNQAEPKLVTRRYWDLAYQPKLQVSFEEAKDKVRELLTESVRLRMISDVPLGAFLSGGVDSSIIVGIMAQLSSRPVKTFSIGFREAEFNELDHARRIAEKWGTEHHEFIVEPDAVSILPKLVRHYGEPYADSSSVPTYYVSQVTRKHVTVALNGDGGDEAFLGYERYWANHIADRLKMLPGASTGVSFLKRIIADSVQSKSNARRVRRFLNVATMDEKHRYAYWIGYFGSHEKRRLYRPEFAALVEPDAPLDWYDKVVGTQPGLDAVERPNLMDIHSYLPYDLLVKVDIATMASSLEARSPLLDHHLLEYAARLPRQHKLHGRRGKSVLRSAFSDMLPPENVNRRKAGFGVPIGAWFRGPMREMLEEHLRSSSAQIRNYLDGAEIDRILDDHLSQRADYTYKLWNLLMLEMWHREFQAGTSF